MARHKTLADFAKDIGQCVKCGACQASCPSYLSGYREGDVARGKIALAAALLDGTLCIENAAARIARDVDMCLMCGSCVTKCPNNVPTDEIVGALRRQIVKEAGMKLMGKGLSFLLARPDLMSSAARGGAFFSPLALKEVPENSGLRLRFPFKHIGKMADMAERTFPAPARKNLFQRLPEYLAGEPDKPVVGFFAGCSITYLYPEIGEKMVAVLQALGCSVVIPKKQQCCGIPALSSGNGELVERLALKNIEVFSRISADVIVTACASCHGSIHEYYRTMSGLPPDFSSRVKEFSMFLEQEGFVEQLAAMTRWKRLHRVSWHDPCHLKKQAIVASPRALLDALPNVEFVEMEGADRCCGLGGTFSVYHYDRSQLIGQQKMEGLAEADVSMIATACPGCIIQLQDSINHANLPVKAVHLLDLIAEALLGEEDG